MCWALCRVITMFTESPSGTFTFHALVHLLESTLTATPERDVPAGHVPAVEAEAQKGQQLALRVLSDTATDQAGARVWEAL